MANPSVQGIDVTRVHSIWSFRLSFLSRLRSLYYLWLQVGLVAISISDGSFSSSASATSTTATTCELLSIATLGRLSSRTPYSYNDVRENKVVRIRKEALERSDVPIPLQFLASLVEGDYVDVPVNAPGQELLSSQDIEEDFPENRADNLLLVCRCLSHRSSTDCSSPHPPWSACSWLHHLLGCIHMMLYFTNL